MNTILIVEDEQDVSDLIAFNLKLEGIHSIFARDGLEAVETAIKVCPDLIILDLMLPKMDGQRVFQELRLDSRTKDIPILMVSAKGQLEDIISGLALGADDYLTKPFSPRELVLRAQNLLRRARVAEGKTQVHSGAFLLDKNSQQLFLDGEHIDLTPTEFKLLLLLVERTGEAQRREDLLREVWGYRDAAQTRTLDTHVKRLREKIGHYSNQIETVRGTGYRFLEKS